MRRWSFKHIVIFLRLSLYVQQHSYSIHLNDSKNPMGSHKDRHACLDEGEIGMAALSRIINHPKLKHLPFLLETPNELDGYAREIAWLRELREGE